MRERGGWVVRGDGVRLETKAGASHLVGNVQSIGVQAIADCSDSLTTATVRKISERLARQVTDAAGSSRYYASLQIRPLQVLVAAGASIDFRGRGRPPSPSPLLLLARHEPPPPTTLPTAQQARPRRGQRRGHHDVRLRGNRRRLCCSLRIRQPGLPLVVYRDALRNQTIARPRPGRSSTSGKNNAVSAARRPRCGGCGRRSRGGGRICANGDSKRRPNLARPRRAAAAKRWRWEARQKDQPLDPRGSFDHCGCIVAVASCIGVVRMCVHAFVE